MSHFADLRFDTQFYPIFFVICGLKIHKYILFSLQIQHVMLYFKSAQNKFLNGCWSVQSQGCAVFWLEICEFAICVLTIKIADLRFADCKQVADFRQRRKPKKLRICDLRMFQKMFPCPPLKAIPKGRDNIRQKSMCHASSPMHEYYNTTQWCISSYMFINVNVDKF